jgi:hypothetical protein
MTPYHSKRERLIRTAIWLGLRFAPSISDNALENLINKAPATDAQLRTLEEFLRPHNKMPPFDITYGEAKKALATAGELLNEYAVRAMKLEERQIWMWEDNYYYILTVLGEQRNHKVVIQRVELNRQPDSPRATFTVIGKSRAVNPSTMLYLSIPISLDTWQPPDTNQVLDEPDF